MDPSASDMTSIRLAVKLAMYKTPRASSSAKSEACPPIGITRPNGAAIKPSTSRIQHANRNTLVVSMQCRFAIIFVSLFSLTGFALITYTRPGGSRLYAISRSGLDQPAARLSDPAAVCSISIYNELEPNTLLTGAAASAHTALAPLLPSPRPSNEATSARRSQAA